MKRVQSKIILCIMVHVVTVNNAIEFLELEIGRRVELSFVVTTVASNIK
jgi:hypothetical protein